MSRDSRRRTGLPLLVVVCGGGVLAGVGAVFALGMLTAGRGDLDAPAYDVGRDIPISFGSLSIQQVERLDGLSAQDLGGMTHGVHNLVLQDQVEVQVAMLLTNASGRPVDYALPRQFRVVSDAGVEAEQLAGLTAPDGTLPGHSSLSTTLRFLAPRDGHDLFLEFRDPGQERPLRIRVGASDGVSPGGVEDSHQHAP